MVVYLLKLWLISSCAGDYNLKGLIPMEVVHLSHLRVLDLQRNLLSGPLPKEFGVPSPTGSMLQLEALRLDSCRLTGSIPEEWCGLSNQRLKAINLSSNSLSGSLPTCLGNLSHLQDFSVLHNQITGTLPTELNQWTDLQRLHTAYNLLEGSVPPDICQKESLLELSTDCLDRNSDIFVECSCCTRCCDPVQEYCELQGDDDVGTTTTTISP